MAILPIIEWPAKVLETRASEVTTFDADLRKFVANMHETMIDAKGIGLAANQVDDLRRILVMMIPGPDASPEDPEPEPLWWYDKHLTIINPVIVKREGKTRYQEGCLSFPGIYDYVDRASEVWMTYQDELGAKQEMHATDLLSICLQHELDHLDGIVFVERMSRIKAKMIRKKVLSRRGMETIESE